MCAWYVCGWICRNNVSIICGCRGFTYLYIAGELKNRWEHKSQFRFQINISFSTILCLIRNNIILFEVKQWLYYHSETLSFALSLEDNIKVFCPYLQPNNENERYPDRSLSIKFVLLPKYHRPKSDCRQ